MLHRNHDVKFDSPIAIRRAARASIAATSWRRLLAYRVGASCMRRTALPFHLLQALAGAAQAAEKFAAVHPHSGLGASLQARESLRVHAGVECSLLIDPRRT